MDRADAFCKVKATKFDLIGTTSAVFNLNELSEVIWVEADKRYINSEWELKHVHYFLDAATDLIEYMSDVDNNSPWFAFPIDKLKTESGFHMYKLQYQNMYTHEIQYLYVGYTIQDDSPDTSNYVYMNSVRREENS